MYPLQPSKNLINLIIKFALLILAICAFSKTAISGMPTSLVAGNVCCVDKDIRKADGTLLYAGNNSSTDATGALCMWTHAEPAAQPYYGKCSTCPTPNSIYYVGFSLTCSCNYGTCK